MLLGAVTHQRRSRLHFVSGRPVKASGEADLTSIRRSRTRRHRPALPNPALEDEGGRQAGAGLRAAPKRRRPRPMVTAVGTDRAHRGAVLCHSLVEHVRVS
jgi:hypothetical protein